MTLYMDLIDACLSFEGTRKVRVSRTGVGAFNLGWPCSELRDSRAYWFEFDANQNLIDTDVPEQDNGPAASALSQDCEAFLFDGTVPEWVRG
jgi:hypothetical protein